MNKYFAEIRVVLRQGILDVQGKATENSLHSLEFRQINNVRIGKVITLDIEANSVAEATSIVDDASKKLLANPIVEDYHINISESK
jgi:phosphoribosylformylglycinamidine synthase